MEGRPTSPTHQPTNENLSEEKASAPYKPSLPLYQSVKRQEEGQELIGLGLQLNQTPIVIQESKPHLPSQEVERQDPFQIDSLTVGTRVQPITEDLNSEDEQLVIPKMQLQIQSAQNQEQPQIEKPVKVGNEIMGTNYFGDLVDIQVKSDGSTVLRPKGQTSAEILKARERVDQMVKQLPSNEKSPLKEVNRLTKLSQSLNPLAKTQIEKRPVFKAKNSIESNQPAGKKIDFNHFEFYDRNYEWQVRSFTNSFQRAAKLNKKKIEQATAQLASLYLTDQLNDYMDSAEPGDAVPQMFRENNTRFVGLMLRSPRVQEVIVTLRNRLTDAMNYEIANNKEAILLYLRHPRVDKRSLSQDSKTNPLHDFPAFHDAKQEQTRNLKINEELNKAKFNHARNEKEKKNRQRQMRGLHKHLQAAVQNGNSTSLAEAARQANEKKNEDKQKLQKEEIEEQKEKARIRREKRQQQKKKKEPYMNQFQKDVKEKASEIDKLIEQADLVNYEIKNTVNTAEKEMRQLENEIHTSHALVPGQKIHSLLSRWANEDIYSDEEISLWANELWMSLSQYEEYLRNESKGYELEMERLRNIHRGQIDRVVSVTSVHIEALESTLIENKLKLLRERERAEMTLADRESQEMNEVMEEKAVDQLIEFCKQGLVLKNLNEARTIIRQMVNIVNSKNKQILLINKEIERKQKLIAAFEQRAYDKHHYFIEEQRLRKFYQGLVLKAVRNLEMLEGEEEKKEMFDKLVHENEDDLNYQRHISLFLEHIDINQIFIDYSNKHFGHLRGLKKLQDNLNLINLVGNQQVDPGFGFPMNNFDIDAGGDFDETQSFVSEMSFIPPQSSQQPIRPSIPPLQKTDGGNSDLSVAPSKQGLNRQMSRRSSMKVDGPRAVSSMSKKRLKSRQMTRQLSRQHSKEMNSPKKRGSIIHNASPRRKSIRQSFPAPIEPTPEDQNIQSPVSPGIQGNIGSQPTDPTPGAGPTGMAFPDTSGGHQFHRKVTQGAAKAKLLMVIKDAMNGVLDDPVVSKRSGGCTNDLNKARNSMVDFIKEHHPDELEAFAFISKAEKKQTASKKDKAAEKKAKAEQAKAKKKLQAMMNKKKKGLKESPVKSSPDKKAGETPATSNQSSPEVNEEKRKSTYSKAEAISEAGSGAESHSSSSSLSEEAAEKPSKSKSKPPKQVGASGADVTELRKNIEDLQKKEGKADREIKRLNRQLEDKDKEIAKLSKMAESKTTRKSTSQKPAAKRHQMSAESESMGSPKKGRRIESDLEETLQNSHDDQPAKARGAKAKKRILVTQDSVDESDNMEVGSESSQEERPKRRIQRKDSQPKAELKSLKVQIRNSKMKAGGKGVNFEDDEDFTSPPQSQSRAKRPRPSSSPKEEAERKQRRAESKKSSRSKNPDRLEKESKAERPEGKRKGKSEEPKKRKTEKASKKTKQPEVQAEVSSESSESLRMKRVDVGACVVQNELKRMFDKKFKKPLEEEMERIDQERNKFKMKAMLVQSLQEQAQNAMEMTFATDDYLDLFQPDVQNFFSRFNKLMIKMYEFGAINKFIDSQGRVAVPPKQISIIEKNKLNINNRALIARMTFGDFIKPTISEEGELLGFQIRPKVIAAMYKTNQMDSKVLKRAINVVVNMNKLLRDGLKNDFQVDRGFFDPTKKSRIMLETGIQVDPDELKMNKDSDSENESVATPRTMGLQFLREHLLELLSRGDPDQLEYYETLYGEFDFQEMFDLQMEGIFFDEDDKKAGNMMSFEDYLSVIFDWITKKVDAIKAENEDEKKVIILEDLLAQGGGGGFSLQKKKMKTVASQAVAKRATIGLMTGPELMAGSTKNKGRISADRAIFEEFQSTLELFDEFTERLNQVDYIHRMAYLKQLREGGPIRYDGRLVKDLDTYSKEFQKRELKFKAYPTLEVVLDYKPDGPLLPPPKPEQEGVDDNNVIQLNNLSAFRTKLEAHIKRLVSDREGQKQDLGVLPVAPEVKEESDSEESPKIVKRQPSSKSTSMRDSLPDIPTAGLSPLGDHPITKIPSPQSKGTGKRRVTKFKDPLSPFQNKYQNQEGHQKPHLTVQTRNSDLRDFMSKQRKKKQIYAKQIASPQQDTSPDQLINSKDIEQALIQHATTASLANEIHFHSYVDDLIKNENPKQVVEALQRSQTSHVAPKNDFLLEPPEDPTTDHDIKPFSTASRQTNRDTSLPKKFSVQKKDDSEEEPHVIEPNQVSKQLREAQTKGQFDLKASGLGYSQHFVKNESADLDSFNSFPVMHKTAQGFSGIKKKSLVQAIREGPPKTKWDQASFDNLTDPLASTSGEIISQNIVVKKYEQRVTFNSKKAAKQAHTTQPSVDQSRNLNLDLSADENSRWELQQQKEAQKAAFTSFMENEAHKINQMVGSQKDYLRNVKSSIHNLEGKKNYQTQNPSPRRSDLNTSSTQNKFVPQEILNKAIRNKNFNWGKKFEDLRQTANKTVQGQVPSLVSKSMHLDMTKYQLARAREDSDENVWIRVTEGSKVLDQDRQTLNAALMQMQQKKKSKEIKDIMASALHSREKARLLEKLNQKQRTTLDYMPPNMAKQVDFGNKLLREAHIKVSKSPRTKMSLLSEKTSPPQLKTTAKEVHSPASLVMQGILGSPLSTQGLNSRKAKFENRIATHEPTSSKIRVEIRNDLQVEGHFLMSPKQRVIVSNQQSRLHTGHKTGNTNATGQVTSQENSMKMSVNTGVQTGILSGYPPAVNREDQALLSEGDKRESSDSSTRGVNHQQSRELGGTNQTISSSNFSVRMKNNYGKKGRKAERPSFRQFKLF